MEPVKENDPNKEPIKSDMPSPDPAMPPAGDIANRPKTDQPNPVQPQDVGHPKSSKKKLIIVLVLLLVIAGGALAYWMMNKDDSSNTKTSSSAPVVVKKDIAVMHFGSQNGMVTEFYPGAESITSTSSIALNKAVFEGLVSYSGGPVSPLLAKKWTNPDSNTWVFTLQDGVTFHNGHPLTAQIVKDSLLASTPATEGYDLGTIIKSIETPDSKTVKITTTSPDPLFLNRLVQVYVYDTTSKTKNSADNGTGPFTTKAGSTNNYDQIHLVAYDKYWGQRPYVRAIEGTAYDDEDALAKAVKDGKVDLAFYVYKSHVADISKTSSAFTAVTSDISGAYELQPLTLKTGSPVQKKAVRQALYEAIDPALVIKASAKDGEPATQIVPNTIAGFNPAITRPALNVAGAKKLLADAGYPNGLTLSIFYGPPAADSVKEIGRQLKAIGVTLDYHQVSSFEEFDNNIKTNKYDLNYISNFSDFTEETDILQSIFTKSGDSAAYDSAQVDALLVKVTKELNTTTRVQELQQINKILADDVATIPVYVPTQQIVMRANYGATFGTHDGAIGAYLSSFYMK